MALVAVPVGYNLPMKSTRQLTAIIEREGDAYVALCPELDIASQGDTVETARTSLIEALELFFESADPTEVARRRPPSSGWSTSEASCDSVKSLNGSSGIRRRQSSRHG